MVKKLFTNTRSIISKYRISAALITVSCLIFTVTLGTLWANAENAIKASEELRLQTAERVRESMAELETERKKAEEEKAAKEAEEAETNQKAAEEQATPPPVTSQPGSCNASTSHINPVSIDVVVNKKHCLVPLAFVPPDLVTSPHGATLSAKAIDAFNQMFAAAAAANQPFIVSSSYRSYNTQVSTYNYWVSVSGQAQADTYSARPGFSEHQTGFAVDVGVPECELSCFGGTSQYGWFQANAATYGFIQRYYAGYEAVTGYRSEEWHYRYVGTAVAQDMKSKGVKTLEEYWGVEGGGYR